MERIFHKNFFEGFMLLKYVIILFPQQDCENILNDTKYECCSITISPTIQPSKNLKNEFVFLNDCSGSIENARECLKTFNLRQNSLFNIILFRSRYIKSYDRS